MIFIEQTVFACGKRRGNRTGKTAATSSVH